MKKAVYTALFAGCLSLLLGGEQYDRINEHYRGKKQNREERGESKSDRGNKGDKGPGQGNNR